VAGSEKYAVLRTESLQRVLTKFLQVVNGELASYRSKLFVQQLRSTYKTLVTDLVAKLPQQSTLKSKGKGGLTAALLKKKEKQ